MRVLVATLAGRVRRVPSIDGTVEAIGTARLAETLHGRSNPLARRMRTRQATRAAVLADYHAGNARAARTAIDGLVRAGYHVGPAPYGYRVTRVPMPAGARTGPRRRLAVDASTGPVVTVIFGWRVDERLGYTVIARRLAADPDHYPPPTHPAPACPGRGPTAMSPVCCATPATPGARYGARTRDGHRTAPVTWITSGPFAHEPLVDPLTFALAQSTGRLSERRGTRRPT